MLRWSLVLAITGCAFHHGAAAIGDGGEGSGSDANQQLPDGTGEISDAPLAAWGTPVWVGVTAGADDPTLTGDLLELYFNYNNDVYVAKRAAVADPWGTPVIVPLVSSASIETTPEVSYDGLTLSVSSDRPGGLGSYDLWISKRNDRSSAWSAPVLVPVLNTIFQETGAVMTSDKLAIVFSTTKVNGSPDMFMSERTIASAQWATPVELTTLNTLGHEGSAFLTDDKLWIYFDSDRDGGVGLDLFYTHRGSPTATFPAAQPLSDINGTATDEQDPWISPDDRHLYFYSDRNGSAGLWESSR